MTLLITLILGFTLGLIYSTGKQRPVVSAINDCGKVLSMTYRFIRGLFSKDKSKGKADVIDI